MFRSLFRKISPNPLDVILYRAERKKEKRFLLVWNRGLGDIALGLYAIVARIREEIPDASITFLTRENLKQGFLLLEGVEVLIDPTLERGQEIDVITTLKKLHVDPKRFDVIIEKPDPTYWVKSQLGKVIPRLQWKDEYDSLYKNFSLPEDAVLVGVQPVAETNHGPWRNWPSERWQELFSLFEKKENVYVLLLGYGVTDHFSGPRIIDLRGKTSLLSMLSIIKNRLSALILPDSGILSVTYYVDKPFSIKIISLWSDASQGILKQNVASPNPYLEHIPLIAEERDLSLVSAETVFSTLFPKEKKKLW